jgi:hypothetical protein
VVIDFDFDSEMDVEEDIAVEVALSDTADLSLSFRKSLRLMPLSLDGLGASIGFLLLLKADATISFLRFASSISIATVFAISAEALMAK